MQETIELKKLNEKLGCRFLEIINNSGPGAVLRCPNANCKRTAMIQGQVVVFTGSACEMEYKQTVQEADPSNGPTTEKVIKSPSGKNNGVPVQQKAKQPKKLFGFLRR